MSSKIMLLEQEDVTRKEPFDPNYQKELFAGELQKTIGETYFIHLGCCQVLPNGFLLRELSLFPRSETFYSTFSPLRVLKNIAKVSLASLTCRVKTVETRPVLLITDEFSNGYFHWIADCLSKLEALEQVKGKNCLKDYVLVVPAMADFPYLRRSLELFAFKQIIILKKNERIFCHNLSYISAVASTGNYRPKMMQALRQRFLAHWTCGKPKTKRLFISRQKASRRKILHEESLFPVLQKYDYTSVVLEELAFDQQVALVNQAQVVVGLHGAGLTNILFMLPFSHVLEIRFRGDSHNNCYFSLASALDLHYHYILVDKVSKRKNVQEALARLDLADFEEALKSIENVLNS